MKDQQSLRSGWLYRVRPRNRWWKLLEQAPALPCLLLLLLSLSSPSLAQVSEYDCVYTNSTSPPCSSVCLQTCFYSLLPARCSPEGTNLTYDGYSRNGSSESSLRLSDAYSVPQSVLEQLPSDLFKDSFTLSLWVYPMETTDESSVLIQIESSDIHLTLYLSSGWLLITNRTSEELPEDSLSYNTTHALRVSRWSYVAVTAGGGDGDELFLSVNNGGLSSTGLFVETREVEEMEEYLNVSLAGGLSGGNKFSGLMADVGVFSRLVSDSEISKLAGGFDFPSFLPQCLCREGIESEVCNGSLRYNISSHPVEFVTDNNVSTYWVSEESPVLVSLGLANITSLSKIFVNFRDSSPAGLRLQYLKEPTRVWTDLQYYAKNCSTSFGVAAGNSVSSVSDVVCQEILPNDAVLGFYVTASGRDGFDVQELRSTFNASQIRLLIESNSGRIRLERVQVCSDFDSNLNEAPSCSIGSTSSSSLEAATLALTESVAMTIDFIAMITSSIAMTTESIAVATEPIAMTTESIAMTTNSTTEHITMTTEPVAMTTETSPLESLNIVSTLHLLSEISVFDALSTSLSDDGIVSTTIPKGGLSSSSHLIMTTGETSSSAIITSSSAEVVPSPAQLSLGLVASSSGDFLISLSDLLSLNEVSSTSSEALLASSSLVGGTSSSSLLSSSSSLSLIDSLPVSGGVPVSEALSSSEFTASSEELVLTMSQEMVFPSPSEPIATTEPLATTLAVTFSSETSSPSESLATTSDAIATSSSSIPPIIAVSSSSSEVVVIESSESLFSSIDFMTSEVLGASLISSEAVVTVEVVSSSSEASSSSSVASRGLLASSEFLSLSDIITSTELINTPVLEVTSSSVVVMVSPSRVLTSSGLSAPFTSSDDLFITDISQFLTSSLSSSEETGLVSSTEELLSLSATFDLRSSSVFTPLPSSSLAVEGASTSSLSIETVFTGELTSTAQLPSTEEVELTPSLSIEVSSTGEIIPTPFMSIVLTSSALTPSLSLEVSSTEELELTPSLSLEVSSTEEIELTPSLNIGSTSSLPITSLIIETSSSEVTSSSTSTEVVELTSSEVSSTEEIELTPSLSLEVSSTEEIELTPSLNIGISSSQSTELLPSSTEEIELTPTLSLEVSSTEEIELTSSLSIGVSSSQSTELLPSSTEEIELTLSLSIVSSSESTELIPSSTEEIELTPSLSIGVSSSESTELIPSSTEEIELTPSLNIVSSSESTELLPSSTEEIELTPSLNIVSSSESTELIPSSTEEIELTPSTELIPSSTEEIELTPSLSLEVSSTEEIELTPSLSIGVSSSESTELIPSSTEEIELTPSLSLEVSSTEEIELTPSLSIGVSSSESTELIPSSTEEIELTPSLSLKVSSTEEIELTPSLSIVSSSESTELIPSSTEEIELTPSLSLEVSSTEEIELTPSLSIVFSSESTELIPSSTEEIELTPSLSIGVSSPSTELIPSSTEEIELTPSLGLEISSTEEIELTPSLSIGVSSPSTELVPSSTEEIELTPSLSLEISSTEEIELTPSLSIGVSSPSTELVPSSTEEIELTPSLSLEISSTEEIELTPSLSIGVSSPSTELIPSSTEEIELTPSLSLEMSSTEEIELTPSLSIGVSSPSTELIPSSTEEIELTPSLSLEISSTEEIELTPSLSIGVSSPSTELIPSSTEEIELTPSLSLEISSTEEIELTPSLSIGVSSPSTELIPSSTEEIELTPSLSLEISSTEEIELTPSLSIGVSSPSTELISSSTEEIELTPSLSLEISSTEEIELTPSLSIGVSSPSTELIPSSTEEIELTPSLSLEISSTEEIELTPSLSIGVSSPSTELIPSSTEEIELTPSLSLEISSTEEIELTPSLSIGVSSPSTELIPSSTEEIELTPSLSLEVSSTEEIELTPSLSFSIELTPSASSLELSSSEEIELTPSLSIELSSTEIIELTSSIIELTSTFVLSSSLTPTPSPTSVSVTPTVIINGGFGVVLEEPLPIDSSNEAKYNFTFGLFGIKLASNDESSIIAQIGNFSIQESFTQRLQTVTNVTGALSTYTLWPDQPFLTALIQARDIFGNTLTKASPLNVTAKHNATGSVQVYECTALTVTASGACKALVSIKEEWFNEDSVVDFTINVNGTEFRIGSVQLRSPPPSTSLRIGESLYIQLPQTPLLPGGMASLSIKSSYNYSVFGFNIDCRLGGGENASFVSPYSPQVYSLLSEYYQDQRDRIALSGFRNRDQFSTTPVNEDQTLVTFNVSLPSTSSDIDISCYSKGLSLTTRLVLVPTQSTSSLPVLMISRNGSASEVGQFLTEEDRVRAILPFTRHSTFLNIAPANASRQDLGGVRAIALFSNGRDEEVSSLSCTSQNKDVIQVKSDCSDMYFDGSETDGSDSVIIVEHTEFDINASLPVRAWILKTKTISISVQDPVLNATGDCDNITYYQTSGVSLSGTIAHNAQSHNVVLTTSLKHLLTTGDVSIAVVEDAIVVGRGPGYTSLCLNNTEPPPCTGVTVSNEFALPLYLSLFPFSSLSINLDTSNVDPEQIQIGLISIGQEFHYRLQPVYINTLLVYEDNNAVNIDTSRDLYLSVRDNTINSRFYLIQDGDDKSLPLIEGTWRQCSETAIGSVPLNVTLYLPFSILIEATASSIAPSTDPLALLGYTQSTSLLTLTAVYNDTEYNTMITSNATYNVTLNDTSVLSYSIDINGSITLYPEEAGYVSLSVIVSEYGLSGSISIVVLESQPRIRLFLNTTTTVTSIQRIADTSYYQEVRAEAFLYELPTETTRSVTDAVLTSGSDSVLQFNGNFVTVNKSMNIEEDRDENITAFFIEGDDRITASTLLSIRTDSCNVKSVSVDFPEQFIDFPGTTMIANCRLTLCDGFVIEKSFNEQDGSSLYGNDFVRLSTNDSSVAVVLNGSIIRLEGTANDPVSIYCTSGGITGSVSVIFNALPNTGEVDLGSNDGLPYTVTNDTDTIVVPVTVGAGNYEIGAIEIDIDYNPSTVLFLNATQGIDWFNGSLSVAEVTGDKLRLGGVLNGGVKDPTLHLANMYFMTRGGMGGNTTVLQATPQLLAIANLELRDVKPENPQTDTLSVRLPSRSRRDLSRIKRQLTSSSCAPNFPLGDINADCCVDQRDVYFFQEYNLASVHNFSGSPESTVIIQTIENNSIILDVDGDGIVTLDDIVTVEQVSSGLVYNMSASYELSCDCSFSITINVSTVNGLPVDTEMLHVFVHMAAYNQTRFIQEVNDIEFSLGSRHQILNTTEDGLYSVILRANLSFTGDTHALYQVKGVSSFTVSNVGMSFIQAVANTNGEIRDSRVSGLFGSAPLVTEGAEEPFVIAFDATQSEGISLTLDNLMPHIIVNPTCVNVPPSEPPSLPLLLNTSGTGYLVSNVTQFNQTYYEGTVYSLNDSVGAGRGSVIASVEGLRGSLLLSRSLHQVNSLRHPVASFDESSRMLTVGVQVFNSIQSSTVNISVENDLNTVLDTVVCTPAAESGGICSNSFNLSSYTFTDLNVSFTLINNDTITSSVTTSVDVSSIPQLPSHENGFTIILPPYPLKPGSSFDVQVYSNSTYPLISFSLNLTLSTGISLTGTYSPDSLWGVYCTESELHCVGYRTNFQSLSVSPLSSPEHLFSASFRIPSDYIDSSVEVSATVGEMHDLFYQSLRPTNNVLLVNGSGSGFTSVASVAVDNSDDIIALYAYVSQTELVNTAVLNGMAIRVPIKVWRLYENNSLIDVSSLKLCQLSNGVKAIHLDGCNAVLNGSETEGADNVTVSVGMGSITTSVRFKVWYPGLPLQLRLGSYVLKAIDGAMDPTSCGSQLYQSTTISVLSSLSTTTESLANVDLFEYVLDRIRFTPDESIALNASSRTVQGMSPSVVTLFSSVDRLFDNVTLQVSHERVSIHYLYTILLTDISLNVRDTTSGAYSFSASLSTSFQYINDTGVSVTVAVFSDDSVMPVTDLVSVDSSNTDSLSPVSMGLFRALSSGTTTLTTEWNNPTATNCTPTVTCLRSSSNEVQVSLPSPSKLFVMTSSLQVAGSETISRLLPSIPLRVELYVALLYPNDRMVNVTGYVNINHSIIETGDDDGIIVVTADSLNNQSTTLLFSYTASGVTLMETIRIEVVDINYASTSLSLVSVAGNNPISTLSSIEGTRLYEQGHLEGSVAFSNGMTLSLSSPWSSLYNISSSSDQLSITNDLVTVQNPPSSQSTPTINLMLAGSNDIVASVSLTIYPQTDTPIRVSDINITLTTLTGKVGDTIPLDAAVELGNNGGIITSLRQYASNAGLTEQLISFSTTDTDHITINPTTAEATLLRNSDCSSIAINARIGASSNYSTSVSVVILPGPLEIGLQGPVNALGTASLFSIQLSLNAGSNTINAIEGSLVYDGDLLEVVNMTVEGTDWPGGPIFHDTQSLSRSATIFSGIALNGGLTGDNVHFANVLMMTKTEGSTEVYANLTSLIQYNSESWSNLVITDSVSSSNHIIISVGACNQPLNQSSPTVLSSNCSPNMIKLANDASIACPVSVNTTTESLYALLQGRGGGGEDVNLNGVSDFLDPLYTTQVSSGLLSLLVAYPSLTNSTRDVNGNYCNVTISSRLIGGNGQPLTGLSVYYLLSIRNSRFNQLFNTTYAPQPVYSSGDESMVLLSSVSEGNGEYTLSLDTMLTEISSGTLSVSIVQSTQNNTEEYSPARVLLMSKRGSSQDSLYINTDIIIHQVSGYTPLITYDGNILCPLLPSPTIFRVFDIESNSTSFTFRIETDSSNIGSILLYNCSLLLKTENCPMIFMNYTSFSTVSYDSNGMMNTNVTVTGLTPYTNYTFYLLNNDDEPITNNITIATEEASPTGFDNLTVINTGPTHITIEWDLPTEQNGVLLENATIIVTTSSGGVGRRRRETPTMCTYLHPYINRIFTIEGLTIATQYSIEVTISNSAGEVSLTVSANTIFPSPLLSVSGVNSMDDCLNLTIDWMYSQVQYNISLNCTATPGNISSTNTTSTLSNGVSNILICYNSVNDANILDPIFECNDSYTVEITLMRNGFSTSSLITVSNNSILIPMVTTTVTTPVPSSSEVSSIESFFSSSLILSTSIVSSMSSSPTDTISSATSFFSSFSSSSPMMMMSSISTILSSSLLSLSSSPSMSEITSSTSFIPSSSSVSSTISSSFISSPSSSLISSISSSIFSISFSISSSISFSITPSSSLNMATSLSPSTMFTSTMSTSTTSTSTATPEDPKSPSSAVPTALGVVFSIIILLVIVLIVVILLVARHRTKKRGTMDFYRPGSRTSKDYWFEVEETVEMSPIDIVPVDHQEHYLDETIINSGIIENKGVYSHEDECSREASLSSRPLVNHIKPQPRTGRTVTFNSADPSSFTDDLKPTRPSYDHVEEDNESLIDLNFSEDAISQPYLSLGLTPLSQLSPDPLTSSGNPDLGFFPSMLPPVSPMTSLNTGTGISVDTADNGHGLDNLVMPDAMLNYSVPLNDNRPRRQRGSRPDPRDLTMNGNITGSRTLEPLIEQRSLEVDDMSSGVSDIKGFSGSDSLRAHQNTLNLGNTTTASGSSSETQEDNTCIFPSALDSSPPLSLKQNKARGQRASAKTTTTDRDMYNDYFDGLGLGASTEMTSRYRSNGPNPSSTATSYTSPVHGVASSSFMEPLFDEPKQRRQIAREKAKAEQKAILMKAREEEEMKKQAKARDIHDSIVKSYSTFSDSSKPQHQQPPPSISMVLQKAARIDAVAELQEENSKKIKGSQSQDSIGGPVGSSSRYPSAVFSPQHRYSNRPRQPSTDSVDMKVTDDQITAL